MKINTNTSHPSAFISSTFNDLKAERAAVAAILKRRGLNINALDIKPASNNSSKDEILRGIRESDFVILIIAERYGSIIPRMTESQSTSVTQWEYQKALSFEKPVLAYYKNPQDLPPHYYEDINDPQFRLKISQLSKFKHLVSSRHNPAYFNDEYELAEKIDSSLISVYRTGIERYISKHDNLKGIIKTLETKIESLENKVTASSNKSYGLSDVEPRNTLLGLSDIDKPKDNNLLSDSPLGIIGKQLKRDT